jgi:hypothetical protein
VSVSGSAQVGQLLTGRYTYVDAENDPEASSAFQWYAASGNSPVALAGATASTYTAQGSNLGQALLYCVTPKASSGASPGAEACSAATAPVGAAWIAALITSGPPPNGTVGAPYRFTVTASGTPLITFSASGLPPGLNLDARSGLLSGTPSAAGSYSAVITAFNTPAQSGNSAGKDAQAYTIVIAPAAAVAPASVPTLSEWSRALLSGLILLLGFGTLRRRHR